MCTQQRSFKYGVNHSLFYIIKQSHKRAPSLLNHNSIPNNIKVINRHQLLSEYDQNSSQCQILKGIQQFEYYKQTMCLPAKGVGFHLLHYSTCQASARIDELTIETSIIANCSTESSQKNQQSSSGTSSPVYAYPKIKELLGELSVYSNGSLIQVIQQQTKTKKRYRKFSDMETYAMSTFNGGPKCSEIPVPLFLMN